MHNTPSEKPNIPIVPAVLHAPSGEVGKFGPQVGFDPQRDAELARQGLGKEVVLSSRGRAPGATAVGAEVSRPWDDGRLERTWQDIVQEEQTEEQARRYALGTSPTSPSNEVLPSAVRQGVLGRRRYL